MNAPPIPSARAPGGGVLKRKERKTSSSVSACAGPASARTQATAEARTIPREDGREGRGARAVDGQRSGRDVIAIPFGGPRRSAPRVPHGKARIVATREKRGQGGWQPEPREHV